ncbi:Low affinity iron permease [Acephala macrosclerotiorum]|nr:Low affinity iron permease [Acephala macrosclerotiorum]
MESTSRWVCQKWKRASSPPLHPRLEITATTRMRLIESTENVSQNEAIEMSPTQSLRNDSSASSSTLQTELISSSSTPPQTVPALPETHSHPSLKQKIRKFNILNSITNIAGSYFVFISTIALLLIWAILGGVLGTTETWQIVMQDASSIQCYVSDTLLMRQQQNGFRDLLNTIGELRSRNRSLVRMLRSLTPSQRQEVFGAGKRPILRNSRKVDDLEHEGPFLKKWFDIMCDGVAIAVGSLPTLILYAAGVVAWLALGAMLDFSDLWQLYMNTGVAIELTLTSMFLQHVRRRHGLSLDKTLKSTEEADYDLEDRLRSFTGDTMPHQTIIIEPPERNFVERRIDEYAFLVGGGFGAACSIVVFGVWLGIGHTLHYNANWWLIIGTWTGLVGFVDAFILRNVGYRQNTILDEQIRTLEEQDLEVYSLLALPTPRVDCSESMKGEKRLSYRISRWFVMATSKWYVIVCAQAVVALVLLIATALRWSETGQLIANTPTMIIEGFLLLVLIQAHNIAIIKRRLQFGGVLERREVLDNILGGSESPGYDKVRIEVEIKQ